MRCVRHARSRVNRHDVTTRDAADLVGGAPARISTPEDGREGVTVTWGVEMRTKGWGGGASCDGMDAMGEGPMDDINPAWELPAHIITALNEGRYTPGRGPWYCSREIGRASCRERV